ncbi:hypothetical protein PVK06_005799 [Gossypium arboreum]|uniref:RNase H type-1 domain-containing protein n=1 Tax=Gossypium arboreum TaxID=29729 RepID=A0ABR0QVH9_GOSAR|nr:hypothetical protein PVK06_005799 [Gossypium arboreum]
MPRTRIYFDGAFDSSSFTSATGLVVRDMTGNLMALKSIIHNNISSSFAAEAHACLEGIKLGISLGLQSATIMGDSKTIIKKSQTTSPDKSVIGAIINDIQNRKRSSDGNGIPGICFHIKECQKLKIDGKRKELQNPDNLHAIPTCASMDMP